MAIKKKGKWRYADSQADIPDELRRFGELNEDVPTQFADAKCPCGSTTFGLASDGDAGAAVRTCTRCKAEHPIGDSADYLDEADLTLHTCVCGEVAFEITAGVALYDGSQDVRWLYLGCRCTACGLVGCYADWTSEFPNYPDLLKNI